MMELRPIFQKRAAAFVDDHHRHNPAPRGWLFGTSLLVDGKLGGVAFAGRPNAPALQDGVTVEVTRVCTLGQRNACSPLYAACCRAAAALGYRRAVTYTLASESGASVKAAGFTNPTPVDEREWDRPKRRRVSRHTIAPRIRWEREL